ncbi:unnamed protein product [Ceutorhynchus assimilis]|uniref:Uncharacterized protein n=1 Tax=Ceutorhynchus assimilis TaxID=467358 RepID=A0A9N9QQH2_9CUCU|nr:unnamed protein product [Ceutorhynchus assimilis]
MKSLKESVELIEKESKRSQARQMSNIIIVRGINENVNNVYDCLVDIFKNKLKIVDISKRDLNYCYRIGAKDSRNNKSRPLAVQFCTKWIRDQVFFNKKHLKGSQILITEIVVHKQFQLNQNVSNLITVNLDLDKQLKECRLTVSRLEGDLGDITETNKNMLTTIQVLSEEKKSYSEELKSAKVNLLHAKEELKTTKSRCDSLEMIGHQQSLIGARPSEDLAKCCEPTAADDSFTLINDNSVLKDCITLDKEMETARHRANASYCVPRKCIVCGDSSARSLSTTMSKLVNSSHMIKGYVYNGLNMKSLVERMFLLSFDLTENDTIVVSLNLNSTSPSIADIGRILSMGSTTNSETSAVLGRKLVLKSVPITVECSASPFYVQSLDSHVSNCMQGDLDNKYGHIMFKDCPKLRKQCAVCKQLGHFATVCRKNKAASSHKTLGIFRFWVPTSPYPEADAKKASMTEVDNNVYLNGYRRKLQGDWKEILECFPMIWQRELPNIDKLPSKKIVLRAESFTNIPAGKDNTTS